ncbi:MAG TPA: creatininase family protein [Clostridia bacterium]|nr:creatininase family protein [Clostridia bacterium]
MRSKNILQNAASIGCILLSGLTLMVSVTSGPAQTNAPATITLPTCLEELSSRQLGDALKKSSYTCLLPMGILEKHGPHLPIGTDLLQVREMCLRAASQEYAVVFPSFYFGQINEARHQPGAIAYSHDLIWKLLQETCDELARNGFRKIVLVNGHGGNNDWVRYFCISQLEKKRDYCLYLVDPWAGGEVYEAIKSKLKSTMPGGHADETETSMIMALNPKLVDLEGSKMESGEDQGRLSHLKYAYTGIAWYAGYPNHYSGEAHYSTAELGELQFKLHAKLIADATKEIKADTNAPALQAQFFKEAQNPTTKFTEPEPYARGKVSGTTTKEVVEPKR